MFNNGTVSKNSSYEDICICNKQFVNARVAYPTYGAIRVNNETNAMIEWEYNGVHGEYSQMSWDWEILKSFLMRHNILVTWIACHTENWGESGTLFKVPQFNVA